MGCGTGIFTKKLIACYQPQRILATDLSPQMVEHCLERFSDFNLKGRCLDGESFDLGRRFALIASSQAVQWFQDPRKGVAHMVRSLIPEGILAFSCPVEGSFPEWKALCRRAGVKSTLNRLPTASSFCEVLHQECSDLHLLDVPVESRFKSPWDFLRFLKETGADLSLSRESLSMSDVKKISREWNGERFTVTQQIILVVARRKNGAS